MIKSTIFFLLVLAGNAFAGVNDIPRVSEVRLGFSSPGNVEAQALFSPLRPVDKIYDTNLAWLFSPRPLLGVSISMTGKTSIAYAGLAWTRTIYGPLFFEVSAGGIVHDQTLDQIYTDRPSPLSTRVMFRETFSLGYAIDENWQVVTFYDHSSNGNLGYRNRAIDRYGVLVGRKIGATHEKSVGRNPGISSFSWDGFYAGFSVGATLSHYNLLSPVIASTTNRSVIIGAQAGYNRAYGKFVLGGELDYAVQNAGGSAEISGVSAFSASSHWLATARGRIGREMNLPYVSPRTLVYATGGIAVSRIAKGYCLYAAAICYVAGDVGGGWQDYGVVRLGWVAGAGFEVPMTERITAKLEYLFVDFGTFSINDAASSNTINFKQNIFRGGLNLKFN